MKNYISSFLLLIPFMSWSQPQLSAWLMNTTNTMASYDTTPAPGGIVTMTSLAEVTQVCYDANDFYVESEGLAGYTMGPWSNPNTPLAQGFIFKFSMSPQEETGTKFTQPKGGIGVAINGVKMYGYTDDKSYNSSLGSNSSNGDNLWHSDAWISEGTTMDVSGGGHCDGSGIYHYHATPFALYTDPNTGHSIIIGYMHDGFPIYGPFGYSNATDNSSSIVRMTSGYSLRSITDRTILPTGGTSTPPGPAITSGGSFDLGTYIEDYEYSAIGSLDEYNGRYCVTPDYPGGTYAYFLSTDSNGDPDFPYIMGPAYYGVTVASSTGASAGTATIPGGVTCGSTDIITIENELSFNLYPNPATDNITVNAMNDAFYELYDGKGSIMLSGEINQGANTIGIHDLTNGIYFLRINSFKGSEVHQVIKH